MKVCRHAGSMGVEDCVHCSPPRLSLFGVPVKEVTSIEGPDPKPVFGDFDAYRVPVCAICGQYKCEGHQPDHRTGTVSFDMTQDISPEALAYLMAPQRQEFIVKVPNGGQTTFTGEVRHDRFATPCGTAMSLGMSIINIEVLEVIRPGHKWGSDECAWDTYKPKESA